MGRGDGVERRAKDPLQRSPASGAGIGVELDRLQRSLKTLQRSPASGAGIGATFTAGHQRVRQALQRSPASGAGIG